MATVVLTMKLFLSNLGTIIIPIVIMLKLRFVVHAPGVLCEKWRAAMSQIVVDLYMTALP